MSDEGASLSAASATCVLQAALPQLRVRVCYEAEQTSAYLEDNDWLLEERVGLWQVCAGLVG